jgi:hypothetical protein
MIKKINWTSNQDINAGWQMEDLNDLEKKIKSPLDLPKTILKKKKHWWWFKESFGWIKERQ